MIDRLVLLLPIAGCLLFGAIVFVELEPDRADDAAIAEVARPEISPVIRRQQGAKPDELVETTLARPLFSSTRRPPQNASAGATQDADLADTRLTGIVTEPARRIAIFAVNGEKPLKLTEGEAVSGWRIESITPREVSLSGPSGTKTLQPKLDPSLASPPGQAALANAAGRVPNPAAAAGPRVPGAPAAAAGRPNPSNIPGAPPPRPPRQRQQR